MRVGVDIRLCKEKRIGVELDEIYGILDIFGLFDFLDFDRILLILFILLLKLSIVLCVNK